MIIFPGVRPATVELLKALAALAAFLGIIAVIVFSISLFSDWMGWSPDTPEQHAARVKAHEERIESQLPGCEIKTFQNYHGVDRLVVVICDGRKTTSSSYEYRRGKYWARATTLEVQ